MSSCFVWGTVGSVSQKSGERIEIGKSTALQQKKHWTLTKKTRKRNKIVSNVSQQKIDCLLNQNEISEILKDQWQQK